MIKYAVVIGVVVGAVIGLLLGNNWTAVWGGTLGAFASAWMASLDWRSYHAKIKVLAKKMDISGSGTAIWKAVEVAGSWVAILFKAIRSLAKDRSGQRYLISAGFISALSVAMILPVFMGLLVGGKILFTFTVFLIAFPSAVLCALGVIEGVFIFAITLSEEVNKLQAKGDRETKDEFKEESKGVSPLIDFCSGWMFQFVESERGTARAFGEMIQIRFWNALKILAFCLFVWPPFVFLALANTKTRMSAACAGILALINLGGSYLWWGGIEYGNGNFWLSFAVATALGFYLGRRIAETDFATREHLFPKPALLSQE